MNMKYYNASNHFQAPIKREPKPYSPYTRRPEVIIPQKPAYSPQKAENPRREYHTHPLREPELPIVPAPMKSEPDPLKDLNLNNLKSDDLLLLGIIALLIWNSCDDTLLLLILGYLFIVGLNK